MVNRRYKKSFDHTFTGNLRPDIRVNSGKLGSISVSNLINAVGKVELDICQTCSIVKAGDCFGEGKESSIEGFDFNLGVC